MTQAAGRTNTKTQMGRKSNQKDNEYQTSMRLLCVFAATLIPTRRGRGRTQRPQMGRKSNPKDNEYQTAMRLFCVLCGLSNAWTAEHRDPKGTQSDPERHCISDFYASSVCLCGHSNSNPAWTGTHTETAKGTQSEPERKTHI